MRPGRRWREGKRRGRRRWRRRWRKRRWVCHEAVARWRRGRREAWWGMKAVMVPVTAPALAETAMVLVVVVMVVMMMGRTR